MTDFRRFLRARKWVVQDAYQQFSDTEAFRKANQIEVLYDTIDIDKYEETRKLVCQDIPTIPDISLWLCTCHENRDADHVGLV